MTTAAGAAVAFTLFIGPAPMTAADPGSRGPNSGQSSSRDDSRGRGADTPRGRGSSNDSRGVKAPAPKAPVPVKDVPRSDSRKGELPPPEWIDAGPSLTGTSTQGALRSTGADAAARTGAPATSGAAAAETERPAVTAPQGPRTVRTTRSARGTDTGTGGSGRHSVAAPAITGPQDRPEPVAVEDPVARPAPEPPGPQPRSATSGGAAAVPAAVPQPATVPLSPWRISAPRVVELALTAPPLVADRRPGQPMTSLFGVLGLLLIPVAGAALGYRQARAARSAGVQPHV